MRKIIWVLLTVAIVSGVGYSQGLITRKKQNKTEQTQPASSGTNMPTPKPTRRKLEKNTSSVKVSDPDGYINGHGYVDLGLPSGLKWAYCNLGATTPNEDGDRYARGEVKPKKSFISENYEFVTVLKDGTQLFDKYPNPYSDDLDPAHDAARFSRGESWRIPSNNDWKELCANCTAAGVVYKGKKGMLLTSKHNGKTIFLPLTPLMYENGRTAKNSGDYWSSSTGGNSGPQSFYFSFSHSYEPGGCSSSNAILGHAIRAVAE